LAGGFITDTQVALDVVWAAACVSTWWYDSRFFRVSPCLLGADSLIEETLSEAIGHDGAEAPLSEQIAAAIHRKILKGEFPVGTWLRHVTLAEEFGVSRTPVREALRVLNAQGIVTIVPNRGARVNGHSSHDVLEIGVVRAELEGLAAELAAERIDDDQIARLDSAVQSFEEILVPSTAADDELAVKWAHANDLFHAVILEAAGNKHLTTSIKELRRKLPHNLSYGGYRGNSRLLKRNVVEHTEIAEAIKAQDGARARRLMTAHIRFSNEATARWVERNAAEAPSV
jgi:DNA-binding GntR family transcriptional regulator